MSGPTPTPGEADADVVAVLAGLGWPRHTALRPVEGGADHRIWQTSSGGRDLLVKTVTHGEARFATAAWASRTIRAVGVPAAVVIGYTDRVLVEQRCPGRPLAAAEPLVAVDAASATSAGRLLRRMHDIRVAGYGRLDATGHAALPTLTAWLLHPAPAPDSGGRGGEAEADLLAEARQVLHRHRRLLPEQRTARLVHGDWAARHVIVAGPGQVSGFVDLASVRGGHPLSDLAAWSLQEPAALTTALFDGYFRPHEVRPAALLTLFRVRIAAALLAFNTSPAGTAELADRFRDQLRHDITALNTGVTHTVAPAPLVRPASPPAGQPSA